MSNPSREQPLNTYSETPPMTRRDLLRNMGIIAAATATLPGDQGLHLLEKTDRETAAATPHMGAPQPETTPAPESEPQLQRAHHNLEQNEFGFYMLPVYGGPLITPTAIVVHWTAKNYIREDSVGGVIKALEDNPECGEEGCSVQLFVDREGIIYQLTPRLDMHAIHARGLNEHSVGIEVEGASEADLLKNPVQYQSVLRAVATSQEMFQISSIGDPYAKTGILGHMETDPIYSEGAKSDPGAHYMAKIRHARAA